MRRSVPLLVLLSALAAAVSISTIRAQEAAPENGATIPAPAPRVAPSPSEAPAEIRPVDAAGFLTEARAFHRFMIESARLAEAEAATQNVRHLARQLGRDHARLVDKLGALTIGRAMAPTETGSISVEPEALMARLTGAGDADFDAAYLDIVAEGIATAMTLFTSFSQSADDAALRDFAMAALPVLQENQSAVAERRP